MSVNLYSISNQYLVVSPEGMSPEGMSPEELFTIHHLPFSPLCFVLYSLCFKSILSTL